MGPVRTVAATAAAALVVLVAQPARAVDVGSVKGEPVQLDVTETTIVAQHFDARTPPNQAYPTPQAFEDSGWGSWLNRLNASLRWDRLTAGLRLDSAVYWNRPIDSAGESKYESIAPGQVGLDNESRYKTSIYPAKMWATYAAPGLEVTVGDAYVQFGRGLTLSMRKLDELGIDTTVRGVKLQVSRDPYAVTAVAGFANPSRVDEATGRALWVTSNLQGSDVASPVFGSDRVVGVDFQAGRGLPVTLSSHLVRFTRCAPFAYDGNGVVTGYGAEQTTFTFGTCDSADVDAWLQSLNHVPRGLQASDITMAGQSIEIPTLWGHGKLYVEGAVQQRQSPVAGESVNPNGNALYAALTLNFGPTSTTIEGKSNRNFYTVAGSVSSAAPELALVAYTFLPPAESFNMIDAEGTGDFNACVEGVRVREDVSVTRDLLVYGQGVAAYSLTEQPSGACDEMGHTRVSVGVPAASVQDTAWDGVTGFEYTFDHDLSHVFASTGARDRLSRRRRVPVHGAARRVLVRQVPRRPLVHRDPGSLSPPPRAWVQRRFGRDAGVVDRGRELHRGAHRAEVGLHPGVRDYEPHRTADALFQRRGHLQAHEQLQRPPLRRTAARGVSVRIGRVPLLPALRGGEGRAHAAVLTPGARLYMCVMGRSAPSVIHMPER